MDKTPTPQPSGVVACTHYPKNGAPEPITLASVSDVLATDTDGFVWIALYEPDETTLREVQLEFDLRAYLCWLDMTGKPLWADS